MYCDKVVVISMEMIIIFTTSGIQSFIALHYILKQSYLLFFVMRMICLLYWCFLGTSKCRNADIVLHAHVLPDIISNVLFQLYMN